VAEEERLTLEPGPAAAEAQSTDELEPEPEPHPDDLTRVEGIGPKISSVLAEAGIVTFEQLAGSDPETLSGILRQAGLPFADPTTWPEQAALAADDASDQLDALQEQLSGGRRVG
jgi:predicted flap endonuclease-1-like 5' DNA nuclease